MELIFKELLDCFDMGELHPRLRPIIVFVANEADKIGCRLVVTSVKREDGIHKLLRAVDLVPEDRDIEVMKKLRLRINRAWDYGKEPYEVVPNIRHGTAPHLHLQVRNETTKKEEA